MDLPVFVRFETCDFAVSKYDKHTKTIDTLQRDLNQ